MSKVIFIFKGSETTIQCLQEDKMKDICLKFTSKINVNINKIYCIYNGNIINMELKYNEIVNRIDKERNIMNILVYEKESNNGIICPNCGQNINIDNIDIINKISKFNDNICNRFKGIKEQMKYIINSNNKEINNIIYQLRNIIYIIDNINEDIKKNNEEINKINKILNNINNINNINDIFQKNNKINNKASTFFFIY